MTRNSNLDASGQKLVKKGVTVHCPGIRLPGRVVKVSRGSCLVALVGWKYPVAAACSGLVVVL